MAAVADVAEALAAGDDDWGAWDRGVAAGAQPSTLPPFDLDAAMEAAAAEARAARRDVARARAAGDAPTPEMYAQVQEMLSLFGLPFVIAPAEAEAQCAALDAAGLVDGVATDDNDVFLFGGRRVYRHLFAEKQYVEEYVSDDVQRELGLTRPDLVSLAQLLGCDYAPGVAGVGIVNGVEILNAFKQAGGMAGFRAWLDAPDERLVEMVRRSGRGKEASTPPPPTDPPVLLDFKRRHRAGRTTWRVPPDFPCDAVAYAYLHPRVDASTTRFVQVPPAADELRTWCEHAFEWSAERAMALLEPALKVRWTGGGESKGGQRLSKQKLTFPSPSTPTTERVRRGPSTSHHAPLPVVPPTVCQVSVGAVAEGGGRDCGWRGRGVDAGEPARQEGEAEAGGRGERGRVAGQGAGRQEGEGAGQGWRGARARAQVRVLFF